MQELFWMWESESFQAKLPVLKQELAEDGRALFSASYVKVLRGGNSPVEALLAKLMVKYELIMALIDSGSIVNLVSGPIYQPLGELSHIRVCNKNIIAADNEK